MENRTIPLQDTDEWIVFLLNTEVGQDKYNV